MGKKCKSYLGTLNLKFKFPALAVLMNLLFPGTGTVAPLESSLKERTETGDQFW